MKNDIFYWIKCVFVGFLSILLLNLIILSVRVNLSYSEYDELLRKEITSVSYRAKQAMSEFQGAIKIIKTNYLKDNTYVVETQKKLFGSIDAMTDSIHKTTSEIVPVVRNVNEMVTDTRTMIQRTDTNLNEHIFPATEALLEESRQFIHNMDQSVMLLINGEIAGLIKVTTEDMQKIGEMVQEITGASQVFMSKMSPILDNTDNLTMYVAEVMQDVSELTEFYKEKIIHPNWIQRIWYATQVIGFFAANVAIPLWGVQSVRVIN